MIAYQRRLLFFSLFFIRKNGKLQSSCQGCQMVARLSHQQRQSLTISVIWLAML
jgi:hypothetical protein